MTPPPLALEGVRVVDFSRLLPGPWCTQLLGDLGADVVKVEQTGLGDYSRYNPPTYAEQGVYFTSVNRNKRSIELDLTIDGDREVARALCRRADVIVESFRPGVTAKLEIDYATVARTNPGVVYCSITGFGGDGPLAEVPGHDLSIQGMTGAMGKHLRPGEAPVNPGFQAGDYSGAGFAAISILAAHTRRLRTGQGAFLEVPLYDSMMCWSNVSLSGAMARLAGHSGQPEMEPWGANSRYATYPTRDGKAVTACMLEARTWHRFCEFVGRPDLIADEDWADRHSDHGDRAEAYRALLAEVCLAEDRDALTARMMAAGIPICPVYTADEALTSREAEARGLVRFVEVRGEGRLPQLVDPLARAGLTDPGRRPAPRLGEHGEEIRAEIVRGEEER